MEIDITNVLDATKESFDNTIEHLKHELAKIRTGKASPAMLNGLMVEYYGTPTPLNQVANVSLADSRTIAIQPWEKSMLPVIEKAIFEANLGFTPMNDGEFIRINIPPLTEERRKELVKQAHHYGEEARISLRTTRHKALDIVKKAVKDGYPEDEGKRMDAKIEDVVKEYANKVQALVEAKEKDIMTI